MTTVEAIADPSFENDTGPTPSEWQLSLTDGADGRISWCQEAHSGGRALLVEKTNGLGSLTLTATKLVALRSETEYESAVYFQLRHWGYNATISFANQELDGEGKVLAERESPSYLLIPKYAPEQAWQRQWARWKSDPKAVAVRLVFRITGNATMLAFDDFELTASPPAIEHAMQGSADDEPYDEAAARAALAKRPPVTGSVQMVANRPLFVASDGTRSSLLYKHHGPSRYAGYARAGIHFQVCDADLDVTAGEKGYDFKELESNVLHVLSADPQAYVVLAISVNPSKKWAEVHPDDIWGTESGARAAAPFFEERPHPSYGSPVYREEVARGLTALGHYLRISEVGKVVVGFHFQGGNDGQFYEGTYSELDHSAGHRRGFQQWLREVYHDNVSALREAWGDPSVTFDTARICSEAERNAGDPFLRRRGKEQWVADCQHFHNLAPTRMLNEWAKVLRGAMGRPVFMTTWRPDAIHGHDVNIYAVSDLLDAPDGLDATVAVQEYYGWRQLGGPGGNDGTFGSFRLRGRAQVAEIDYRTYRAWMGGEWHQEQLGATLTPEGFRAQIRRDVGFSASHGMAAWYHDFGAWYDAPDLWPVIAESNSIMEWAHREDAPSPVAEMAVFIDEDIGWRINPKDFGRVWSSHNQQRWALNLSGVPYDLYFLDDIRNPNLPDYRVYLFLTSYTLTKAQAAAIQQRCRRTGKVLVIEGTPGIASPAYDDPVALVRELTDIVCTLLPKGTPLASAPIATCTDPIAAGLTDGFTSSGAADQWVLSPDDPQATAFGQFILAHRPSHALKRTNRGITVLLPPAQYYAGLTSQLVHNLATLGGIRTLGSTGQATYVGSGVAVCHRVQPGPTTVIFAEPVDLIDLDGTTVLARGVTKWDPDPAILDTAVVFYRAAR
ncbi:MAG: beta-galactosidase [Armatimonadota bacterium]